MTKKYYKVEVKCGHVGKNKYVIKAIGITAENAKKAAKVAREMGRVKHDHKDAIRSVIEISFDEYQKIQRINKHDPYFRCKNIQEQRIYCSNIQDILFDEESLYLDDYKEKRSERIDFKFKKYKEKRKSDMLFVKKYVEAYAF